MHATRCNAQRVGPLEAFDGLIKRHVHVPRALFPDSASLRIDSRDENNTRSRAGSTVRYATGKKCPSRQDNDVHGSSDGSRGFNFASCAPTVAHRHWRQIYRPGEYDSLLLASRRERASERAYRNLESMKITLAVSIPGPDEIDTSIYHPAYAWHAWERAGRGETARRGAVRRGAALCRGELTMHNSPYLRRAARNPE